MFTRQFILKEFVRVCLHLLFWCFVLLFYTYFFGFGSNDFQIVLSFSTFLLPVTVATTYVSIYILIPKYLIKKRYCLFAIYSSYTLIVSSYLIIFSIFYAFAFVPKFKYDDSLSVSRNLFLVIISVYLVCIVVGAFKLVQLNLKNSEKTKELETKILETQLKLKEQELNYLKMQIHPHFLFNTLNTMYGFALKKADETPEMILKLSNLLDYLLYQVDKPFVHLSEEVSHTKDYIELEKLRFNKTLDITFNHDSILESTKIAPMILLPFVENSFKHGNLKEGRLTIDITLSSNEEGINFVVENTSFNNESDHSGIGLQNIKKRLELLYKNNFDLNIERKDDRFKVTLKLNHK